ncbi:MAG: hypothetical protein ACKV2Q_07095 [Planctomycetaceae bacterium]
MKPLLHIAFCFVALACSMLSSSTPACAQQPNAIITNQPGFRIPYRFDQAEMRRLRAKEIRLFLSRNNGFDWQHVQTVAPEAGRFDFKAQADGEYWFAVRTLDGTNQLHPDANVVEPGLVVIVDRTAPELKLLLQPAEAGKVQLSWSVSDANLDLSKLSLEFSQGGANWQPVSVKAQAAGQTSWSVPGGGQVSVRGSVTDRAGNVGSAQTSIVLQSGDPGAPMRKRGEAADYRNPIAEGRFPPTQEPPNSSPFGPSANTNVAPPPPQDPFSTFPVQASRPTSAAQPPTQFPGEARIANSFPPTPVASSAGQGRVNTAEWGMNRSRFGSNGRFRAVKSHRFEVNYRIDDVGPSGVSAVELFVTQNNGQKWWKYGDDADKQSPFVVEVPEDGVYGFAIRVRSGAGLADEPPQSGEEPSVVIVVDRTPPTVQLQPIQQGAGGQMNKLTISWRIADDNPSDKPISLAYSANPNGPWEPICGWQPDTGSYAWSVGHGVPSRLYIRLVARDAAGNHSFVDTPQPLLVDLSKPTGRIVDVESNGPQ